MTSNGLKVEPNGQTRPASFTMSSRGSMISSNASMQACVLRMHKATGSGSAFCIWNAAREFRVMIRDDPTESDDATVAFEFGILACEDGDEDDDLDRIISRVLDLEMDGYWDEGLFVVQTHAFEVDKLEKDPGILEDARQALNSLLHWSVCGCGDHFVKDGCGECLACQLMAKDDRDMTTCGICYDEGPETHMHKQACCGQLLHRRCLAKCRVAAGCPFCRHQGQGNSVMCLIPV